MIDGSNSSHDYHKLADLRRILGFDHVIQEPRHSQLDVAGDKISILVHGVSAALGKVVVEFTDQLTIK